MLIKPLFNFLYKQYIKKHNNYVMSVPSSDRGNLIGINPILIYDFYWGLLNEKVKQAVPTEAMRFRQSLHRLLDYIFS